MEINTNPNRKVIHISRTKLIVGIIVLIAIGLFVLFSLNRARYMGIGSGGNTATMMPNVYGTGGGSSLPSMMPQFERDYYYDTNTPNISDTREFLKTSYSAEIKTRKVSKTVKDVKNAVRDAEGRLDSISSGEKYGYISFVVPKSKFDQFRDEIESLTHEKLYTESISSENLLNQKQSIEEQGGAILSTLQQLEKYKKDVSTSHVSKLTSINSELASVQSQLAATRQKIQASADPVEKAQLTTQETTLVQRENTLKYNKDQENKNYAASSASIQAQIDAEKANLEGNQKQDIQFMDNIETVSGSIRITWISCWQMAKIFSPIHPTIIIIVLVIALWYYLNRKEYIPKIEIA